MVPKTMGVLFFMITAGSQFLSFCSVRYGHVFKSDRLLGSIFYSGQGEVRDEDTLAFLSRKLSGARKVASLPKVLVLCYHVLIRVDTVFTAISKIYNGSWHRQSNCFRDDIRATKVHRSWTIDLDNDMVL